MKRLIAAILLCISFASYAQQDDASLRTQANIIRNATIPGSNTAVKIGDMFLSIINNKPNYIAPLSTSGTNSYTASDINISSYSTSLVVDVAFGNANSTAVTLSINGLASKNLKKFSSGSLVDFAPGDISAGQTLRFRYNGTEFTLVGSPPGGAGTGSVTSITATAPLTGGTITTTGSIGITQSTTSTDGYLSSADWNTLMGKANTTVTGDLSGTLPSVTVAKILGNTVPANASGVLTNNGSGVLSWIAPGGGGTVTSVTSADGNITVANTTSTPVLTSVSAPKWQTGRTLSISGDITYTSPSFDGSGNVTAAATYNGTVPVTKGGTNVTSLTAFAPLFGGTTSTGAVQSGTVGTSGQVLTSNGAGALPTFQSAATGFSNPMTTLGDIMYENATPAAARLGGNTTTSKQFLTQTGNGTISATPVWGSLVSADIPNNAANTSGNAATVTTIPTLSGDVSNSGNAVTLANTAVTPGSYTNTNLTVDSKGRITAASTGSGGASTILTPTGEKTANYTAAAGDLVLVDATSSAFTVTLPTAPADLTRIGVKMVKPANATAFTVTVALGGSDHINRTTGATSTTLNRLGRTLNFQYKSSTAVWYVTESDEALERSVRKYFNVEYYGAVHDGQTTQKTTDDGTMNGTTAVLTSASGAVFTASDVGKVIVVSGAGAAGVPLRTTILSFQNSGQVTLSANSSTAVTTANIVWGTDDTAAIQAAEEAAYNSLSGNIYFPNGIYIINGAMQTSVDGASPNSQIYVRNGLDTAPARRSISFIGESSPQIPLGYQSVDWNGAILYSTFATTSGAVQSLLGGIGATGSGNAFGFTDVFLKDIQFRVYTNKGAHAPYITGFDGFNFGTVSTDNASATIDVPLDNSTTALGSGTYGLRISKILNNGPCIVKGGSSQGFETCWVIGEHTLLQLPYALGGYNGFLLLATSFDISGKILVHACNTQIVFENSTKNVPINLTLEVENDSRSKWFDSQTLFTDAGNKATGVLSYTNVALSSLGATFTGGTNLYLKPIDNYIAMHSNTAGGYVIAPGFSATGNLNADFQVSTGLSTSNDTKTAGVSLISNQTGTANAVGAFQVLNSSLGTGSTERRMMLDVTTTNGATNTGLNYRYVMNAGSIVNIWQTAGTRYNLGVNTLIGGSGTLATSPTALLNLTQPVLTSSWLPTLIAAPGAHTGMTTATEFPNFRYDGATQTAASGTTATQRNFWIKRVTYAGTSGTRTITNPYGLYVEDNAAGTNGALTNNYAIGSDGNIVMVTAGNGLYIKEGTNGTAGLAVLVAGTVTVSTTKVTANSRIHLTGQVDGGTPGFQRVSTRTAGTSFVITSSSGSDTSSVAWWIEEPMP